MPDQALIKLDAIRQALAEIQTIDGAKDLSDQSEALRYAAKKAGLELEVQNEIAEIGLRTYRRLGQLLRVGLENGTRRKKGREGYVKYHDDTFNNQSTLSELGIDRMEAHRSQIVEKLPEAEFEQYIAQMKAKGKEITRMGAYRLAKRLLKQKGIPLPPMPTGKYRVIYADPPWSYGNIVEDYFPEQVDHYPLMTIEQICELPIKDMAEDNAVLFLWATSPILEEAFEVIHAWGFEYKTSFVWDKVKHVMGHYNSVRHEFLLICVRGSCTPDVPKLFDSVVMEERTEHSRKPEIFREIIDTLYPHGRRVELFAREETDGWDSFGNEIISRREESD